MSRTRRALPMLFIVLGLLVLLAPLLLTRASAATPTVVSPALDFATRTWSDPWDFANTDDILLDHGPTSGLSSQSIAHGVLSFTISTPAFISPLWAGYPGALHLGRDGALAANMVKAAVYTRLHLHVYASAPVSGHFDWFTCNPPSSSCEGALSAGLAAGWNDIDVPMVNSTGLLPHGKAWSGLIQGLRYTMVPHTSPTRVEVDSIRLYRPSATSALSWTTAGPSARLWWYDASPFVATASQHGGPVAGANALHGSTTDTNVSGFAPGTRFYAVQPDATAEYVGALDAEPRPVIDSPSVAGCSDYATRYVGHPWKFPARSWLAGYANATNLSFSPGGVLTATNAGPYRNDPYIFVPVGSGGIDGRVYHRLTVTESYDGSFNLANVPGGGTMARLMWRSAGRTGLAQTDDIVTYSGKRSITVDLAMATSTLTDPSLPAALRYPFVSTSRVSTVRWDPNEDPGARTWHIYSIRLAADCGTRTTFALTWHDSYFTPASTARVWAISSTGHGTVLGTATEQSGSNTFTVRTAGLAAGRYTLRVDVTTPNGTVMSASSGSPLVVSK